VQDTVHIYTDSPDGDTMGGRLSRARDAVGFSVSELARRLGVKATTIQAWESDRSQPRANRLAMLAGVLNVSLSWLLHGVGVSPADESRSELVNAVSANLKRIRKLQDETNRLVTQIEADLARAAGAG